MRSRLRERHARYYIELLKKMNMEYETGRDMQAKISIDKDLAQLNEAIAWALNKYQGNETAQDLLLKLAEYGSSLLELIQTPQERIRWMQIAAGEVEKTVVSELEKANLIVISARNQQGIYLNGMGKAYLEIDEYEQADSYFQKLSETAEFTGNQSLASDAKAGLAVIRQRNGEFEEAMRLYAEALDLAQSAEDNRRIVDVKSSLGELHFEIGNYDYASDLFIQSLTLSRQSSYSRGMAGNLKILASIRFTAGHYQDAVALINQAIEIGSSLGDSINTASYLRQLGIIQTRLRDYNAAKDAFEKALEHCETSGSHYIRAEILCDLAEIHLHQKAYQETLQYYSVAITVFETLELNDRVEQIKSEIDKTKSMMKIDELGSI